MAGCKAEIEPADPPPEAKTDRVTLIKPPKADGEAEQQPGEQRDESGLEEYGLRLREFLDGIK